MRENDEPLILAGRLYFPISKARAHWRETRIGTLLGDESQAILDHAERIIAIRANYMKGE